MSSALVEPATEDARARDDAASASLHVATYNIHKGFSTFRRRMVIHELREHLRAVGADVLFLQEVLGLHGTHANRWHDWPKEPQYEFLADSVWSEFAYGRNAVYDHGHHGNAILSRFPIVATSNFDLSAHRFERRGLLHCELDWDGRALHCMCVHLGLNAEGRRQQVSTIIERIERNVPPEAPLVVAGDFNDWREREGHRLAAALGLREVFHDHYGRLARTFPSRFPVLRLDRIYARGFRVSAADVYHGPPWSRLSDHAALSARLELA